MFGSIFEYSYGNIRRWEHIHAKYKKFCKNKCTTDCHSFHCLYYLTICRVKCTCTSDTSYICTIVCVYANNSTHFTSLASSAIKFKAFLTINNINIITCIKIELRKYIQAMWYIGSSFIYSNYLILRLWSTHEIIL